MKKQHIQNLLIVCIAASQCAFAEGHAQKSPKFKVKAVVEEMRGISMQLSPTGPSDGRPDFDENKKQKILAELAAAGQEAIPPLIAALKDNDVRMRQNACLALVNLSGSWTKNPRVDISSAIPALVQATKDNDADVRRWASHAISENNRKR